MAKTIELLPCPFCGNKAQFRRFGVCDENILIECTNPHGACCNISTAYTSKAEELLANKWNQRLGMSDEARKAIDEMFESED